ncbi:MAG: redoxin domain-containing protein [Chloroflexi bacterium]|nr:MAG: redoxin domain-containing protein [Chloroflexota bacterium]
MPVKIPASVSEGTTIPDFELRSLSGEMVKPSDYRGKRLVIFFWASW